MADSLQRGRVGFATRISNPNNGLVNRTLAELGRAGKSDRHSEHPHTCTHNLARHNCLTLPNGTCASGSRFGTQYAATQWLATESHAHGSTHCITLYTCHAACAKYAASASTLYSCALYACNLHVCTQLHTHVLYSVRLYSVHCT
jgi:hypothetical protein